MAKKQVVVIGLGRFGSSLARTLSDLGNEVLGLDIDLKRVEFVAEFATQAAQVDATDEEALREMGVRNFDIGVVAIGGDIKSSILVTLLLKRLGVKTVISKAQDDLHGEILEKVGADRVVYPERETGIRVAHALSTPNLVDYLEVMAGYGIAKLVTPSSFIGKELGQLELKSRYGLTPLILRRAGELLINPSRSEVLNQGDVLVLSGKDEQLEALRTT